ncbi:MAG: hypothetical protein JW762_05730 [Dehalococcoidales bacterium]|nr:hypothetical protein [Dehalococcoidales bacterium]
MSGDGQYKFLFWTEYVSNNMEQTSKFLREMFGWEGWPIQGEDEYLMSSGQLIMNIVQRTEEMEQEGVPPHIKNYIDVEDYDTSLKTALDKGVRLVHEAVIPDFCKLGVLKIPGDLYLSIVQYYKGQS